jgi:hypothetical protein
MTKSKERPVHVSEKVEDDSLDESVKLSMQMMMMNLTASRGVEEIVASWASSATSMIEVIEALGEGKELFSNMEDMPESFFECLNIPRDIAELKDDEIKIVADRARDRLCQAITIGAMSVVAFVGEMQEENPTEGYTIRTKEAAVEVNAILQRLLMGDS